MLYDFSLEPSFIRCIFLKPYGILLRQKSRPGLFFQLFKGKGLCRYEAVGIKCSR